MNQKHKKFLKLKV